MKYMLYTYFKPHWRQEAFYELTGMYNTYDEAKEYAERNFKKSDVDKVEIFKDGVQQLALGRFTGTWQYYRVGG